MDRGTVYRPGPLVHRGMDFYRAAGPCAAVARAARWVGLHVWESLCYVPHRLLSRGRTFEFQGRTLPYYCHRYNATYLNERAVEIPIVLDLMGSTQGRSVLEVGNVLSHYMPVDHDVVDKYEESSIAIREDVVDFRTDRRYDVIVSISTLEHVGWDEYPQEPAKPLRAIAAMRALLAAGGRLIVTVPIGQNPHLDSYVRAQAIPFAHQYCLARVTRSNYSWGQLPPGEVRDGCVLVGVILPESGE